jgi:hypothetical protein
MSKNTGRNAANVNANAKATAEFFASSGVPYYKMGEKNVLPVNFMFTKEQRSQVYTSMATQSQIFNEAILGGEILPGDTQEDIDKSVALKSFALYIMYKSQLAQHEGALDVHTKNLIKEMEEEYLPVIYKTLDIEKHKREISEEQMNQFKTVFLETLGFTKEDVEPSAAAVNGRNRAAANGRNGAAAVNGRNGAAAAMNGRNAAAAAMNGRNGAAAMNGRNGAANGPASAGSGVSTTLAEPQYRLTEEELISRILEIADNISEFVFKGKAVLEVNQETFEEILKQYEVRNLGIDVTWEQFCTFWPQALGRFEKNTANSGKPSAFGDKIYYIFMSCILAKEMVRDGGEAPEDILLDFSFHLYNLISADVFGSSEEEAVRIIEEGVQFNTLIQGLAKDPSQLPSVLASAGGGRSQRGGGSRLLKVFVAAVAALRGAEGLGAINIAAGNLLAMNPSAANLVETTAEMVNYDSSSSTAAAAAQAYVPSPAVAGLPGIVTKEAVKNAAARMQMALMPSAIGYKNVALTQASGNLMVVTGAIVQRMGNMNDNQIATISGILSGQITVCTENCSRELGYFQSGPKRMEPIVTPYDAHNLDFSRRFVNAELRNITQKYPQYTQLGNFLSVRNVMQNFITVESSITLHTGGRKTMFDPKTDKTIIYHTREIVSNNGSRKLSPVQAAIEDMANNNGEYKLGNVKVICDVPQQVASQTAAQKAVGILGNVLGGVFTALDDVTAKDLEIPPIQGYAIQVMKRNETTGAYEYSFSTYISIMEEEVFNPLSQRFIFNMRSDVRESLINFPNIDTSIFRISSAGLATNVPVAAGTVPASFKKYLDLIADVRFSTITTQATLEAARIVDVADSYANHPNPDVQQAAVATRDVFLVLRERQLIKGLASPNSQVATWKRLAGNLIDIIPETEQEARDTLSSYVGQQFKDGLKTSWNYISDFGAAVLGFFGGILKGMGDLLRELTQFTQWYGLVYVLYITEPLIPLAIDFDRGTFSKFKDGLSGVFAVTRMITGLGPVLGSVGVSAVLVSLSRSLTFGLLGPSLAVPICSLMTCTLVITKHMKPIASGISKGVKAIGMFRSAAAGPPGAAGTGATGAAEGGRLCRGPAVGANDGGRRRKQRMTRKHKKSNSHKKAHHRTHKR